MHTKVIIAAIPLGIASLLMNLVAHAATSPASVVQITVKTEPPGLQGSFTFAGTPSGTTPAGGSLSASVESRGEYASTETGAPPGLVLFSITCDDGDSAQPSRGRVDTRTVTFDIGAEEIVTCVFHYRAESRGEGGSAGTPGGAAATGGASGGGSAGGAADPGGVGSATPEDCEAPALVPRAGTWRVSNFTGRMVCGSMINMPLKASEQSGVLEIQDCGWTVIGTGLAEDTAPLAMRAVDATSGRYTGSVGGTQDGIPMTIDFTWQLNSAESIAGELSSKVTQQGMTCNMSRPFELKFSGP